MATTMTLFEHISELLANALVDLDGVTLKLALVDSGYTFDATDQVWADMSGDEVASGDGYTTGGETVANPSLSRSGTTTTLDGDDVTWTALTKTFRRGILYVSGTVGALTNPVLAAVLYDDTPGDVSVAGVDFVNKWHASGILTVG